MSDLLLSYAMPISKTIPLTPASTQYLHEVLVLCKPKAEGGEEIKGKIQRVANEADVMNYTDATGISQLFEAGKSYFYIAAVDELKLSDIENANNYQFFTILIDPAFTKEELQSMDLGDFKGVVSWASNEEQDIMTANKTLNNAYFYQESSSNGENMYQAFGSLLSGTTWRPQQYIEMPHNDLIADLGTAESYFADRVNFVLTSEQYGNRLALFVAGGQGDARSITAPYIYEELQVTLQGRTVTYLNLNQPDTTPTEAKLLQNYLQDTIDQYIANGTISGGTINVTVSNNKFMFDGSAQVPEPSAAWRVPTNFIEGGN